MQIVVIDHDASVVHQLEKQLVSLGCIDIVTFTAPGAALGWVQQHGDHIGLVMCGLAMSDIDGIEMMRALKQIGYHGKQVIICQADEQLRQSVLQLAQFYDINLCGVLFKPIPLPQLRAVLQPRQGVLSEGAVRRVPPIFNELELRQSIQAGQFCCHYQPQISMQTGALTGLEAVMRWQHPAHGLMKPPEFLPAVERAGLASMLCEAVLADVLREMRMMGARMVPVALHVPPGATAELAFPRRVEQALQAAQIAPGMLSIMISDATVGTNHAVLLDVMARLRLRGVGVCIANAGGAVGWQNLPALPCSAVKLNQTLVQAAMISAERKAQLRACIAAAHSAGAVCIGAGVENRRVWALLRDLGCDVAQGYLIAKPMPGVDVAEWHHNWPHHAVWMNALHVATSGKPSGLPG